MFKYCKIPLLRPPLVLPKSVLISRAVLILNVEHSSSKGAFFKKKSTGPSCSKLTTSLVNNSLKFTSSDTQIC